MTLIDKKNRLESLLAEMDGALVAFSGGVDSALVALLARNVLGSKALAATAQSPSLPAREMEEARRVAEEIGIAHVIVHTGEMQNPDYLKNPANRCFHCKTELYEHLHRIAKERSIRHILNGINADDLGDHRPGIDAAKQAEIRSPLVEAGLSKQDVRALAHLLGLSVADKPAAACLSSRVPYGAEITPQKLSMIERAEDYLLALGFTQLRVRHHGDVARIELLPEEMGRFFSEGFAEDADRKLKEIGFRYVAVDAAGYRSGSLNEVLPLSRNRA